MELYAIPVWSELKKNLVVSLGLHLRQKKDSSQKMTEWICLTVEAKIKHIDNINKAPVRTIRRLSWLYNVLVHFVSIDTKHSRKMCHSTQTDKCVYVQAFKSRCVSLEIQFYSLALCTLNALVVRCHSFGSFWFNQPSKVAL